MLCKYAVDSVLLEAFKAAGGPTALARGLGLTTASVCRWERIPPARVLQIEKITGISRHRLRPDYYPIEEGAPPPPVVFVRRARHRQPRSGPVVVSAEKKTHDAKLAHQRYLRRKATKAAEGAGIAATPKVRARAARKAAAAASSGAPAPE